MFICNSYSQINMLPYGTCLFLTVNLMPLGSLAHPSCWDYRKYSDF